MHQKTVFKKKIMSLRMDFRAAEVERFNVVKGHMGLKLNTEVIRALISEKYNEIQASEKRDRLQQSKEIEAMKWLETGEYKCPM